MRLCRCVRNVSAAASIGAAATFAHAAAFGPPPALPQTAITQHLDAALPLDLRFVDAAGRKVRLAHYFADRRPVVLVLGYYRCPNLCGLTMHGVLEALDATGLARRDYRIVGVSIDPHETPADAQARQRVDLAYAAALRGDRAPAGPLGLDLLVGSQASIAALAERVGYAYRLDADAEADAKGDAKGNGKGNAKRANVVAHATASADADAAIAIDASDPDRARSRYVHAAGFIVVTPGGRTSRYLYGVRYEPRELRLALVEAASGRIGGLSDRLLLLCAHFDPASGRYSGAVMNLARGVGVALVLGLGGWAWRHRGTAAERGS
ncbi:MAG: SCO family protein [Caldimonas sp.]